jgi:beta-exotoxin I transport system permease protein
MLANVAGKTLLEQRRAIAWWSLGTLTLVLVVFAYYPTVRDNTALSDFYRNLPPAVRALSGGGSDVDVTSPAGYLSSQLFSNVVPILFIIYAVILGAGALGREEDRGTAELLLVTPISRRGIVVQKALGIAALLAALGAALLVSLLIGKGLVGMKIAFEELLEAAIASSLLATTFAALALAISAGLGRRGHAGAWTGAIAVASFMIYSLAPLAPSLDSWRKASPFYWYLGPHPLSRGIDLGHLVVLAVASLVLTGVSCLLFDRRDVYVA